MLPQCFSFFLFLNTLFIPEFSIPFSWGFDDFTFYNSSFRKFSLGEMNVTFTSSTKSVEIIKPIDTTCVMNANMDKFYLITSKGRVESNTILEFSTKTGEGELACESTAANISRCDIDVSIDSIDFTPESDFSKMVKGLLPVIPGMISSVVCDSLSPKIKALLLDHTVNPPLPPPDVVPGALALRDTELFRAARNIALTIKNVLNFSFGIDLLDDPYSNTLRLNVTNMIDRSITIRVFGNKAESQSGAPANGALNLDLIWLGTVDDILGLVRQLLGQPEVLAEMDLHLPAGGVMLGEAEALMVLPAGMGLSIELTPNDLRCEPNTYNYSVRATDAFNVSNVRLVKAGDMGRLFNNNVSRLVSSILSDKLNAFISNRAGSALKDAGHAALASVLDSAANEGTSGGKRFYIPMRSKVAVISYPPLLVVVLYVVGSALVTVCLVCLNVMRHRTKPVVLQGTLEPVSVLRIILEDLLLSICCFVCAGAFLWSNLTTAAYISVGGELHIYGFTLMGTVRDMWDAGLKPLSVLVFLFSGIYPYFKLVCMLLFALVLQRPHARVLRVIDYIGKFSFLDTFVMFIMVTGMPIPGVSDVIILPSFYIFFGATIASVLLGNYTVLLWRRGTTLTKCGEGGSGPQGDDEEASKGSQRGISNPPYVEDEAQLSSEPPLTTSENSPFATRVRPETSKSTAKERWYVNVIILCVMLACLLPAWFVPCLRYRVGGVAPLITPEYKEFNLHQLSNTVSPVCFVVSLFILLIAPCGYALSRTWFTFLASWFAVDAFLLACVAGLLQLNQFVQFMLGPNMEGVYTAHATLLWPLVLLLVASVLQWVLVAVELYRDSIWKCWAKVRGLSRSS